VHSSCPCNELVSIRNRVIGVVPLPTTPGIDSLKQTLKHMRKFISPVSPITYEEFYSSYSGPKRQAYIAAALSLEQDPVCKRDSKIDMFVKCERINPVEKFNPDPRPISARNKRYVLSIGVWLKPLEHELYRTKFGFKHRLIVKGMNPSARAQLLLKKMSEFRSPLVASLDCSRWDKHVNIQMLQLEHDFYNSKCHDTTLAKLLSYQLINKCKASNGTRYTAEGRRMSGDYNTALGNCLLMTAMAITAMKQLCDKRGDPIKYDLMDDGDDCLIIVERENGPLLDKLTGIFLTFGHELKIENKATIPEMVWFCQSSLVHIRDTTLPEHWKFVRNPRKVLSNASTGFDKLRDPRRRRKMFYAIGSCELALNIGVPLLQSFACKLIALGEECDVLQLLQTSAEFNDLAYRVKNLPLNMRPVPISTATRLSFSMAFGITIQEQMDLETIIDQWNPDIFDEYEVPYDVLRDLKTTMDLQLTGS